MAFVNIKGTGNKMTFDIKELDISIVNSLRRIIIAEIPTVALSFDPLSDNNPDITINVNTTALHNEFLAHRLSLLPIKFDKDVLDAFDPHEYIFKLKVKNTGNNTINVTSKDIEIFNSNDVKYPEAFHEKVFPKDPFTKNYILINKLRPNIYNPEKGEEIDIVFKASKNIGKVHSRWSAVSCCALSNIIDDEKAEAALQLLLSNLEGQKGAPLNDNEIETHTKRFKSLDIYRHFRTNKYGEASEFHFKIESECGLKPTEIFQQAFNILIAKLEDFSTHVNDLRITKIHDNQHFYEIIIQDEDYTLLNVLQCMIYNQEVRNNNQTNLEYIGYYQPHPLDSKMILKLKFKDNEEVDKFLQSKVKSLIESLNVYKSAWIKK